MWCFCPSSNGKSLNREDTSLIIIESSHRKCTPLSPNVIVSHLLIWIEGYAFKILNSISTNLLSWLGSMLIYPLQLQKAISKDVLNILLYVIGFQKSIHQFPRIRNVWLESQPRGCEIRIWFCRGLGVTRGGTGTGKDNGRMILSTPGVGFGSNMGRALE